jgi:hypothetical protein
VGVLGIRVLGVKIESLKRKWRSEMEDSRERIGKAEERPRLGILMGFELLGSMVSFVCFFILNIFLNKFKNILFYFILF